jgi:hypothetical protein
MTAQLVFSPEQSEIYSKRNASERRRNSRVPRGRFGAEWLRPWPINVQSLAGWPIGGVVTTILHEQC